MSHHRNTTGALPPDTDYAPTLYRPSCVCGWSDAATISYARACEAYGEHVATATPEPSLTLTGERTRCAGEFLGSECPWTPADMCPIHSTANTVGN